MTGVPDRSGPTHGWFQRRSSTTRQRLVLGLLLGVASSLAVGLIVSPSAASAMPDGAKLAVAATVFIGVFALGVAYGRWVTMAKRTSSHEFLRIPGSESGRH